MSGAVRHSVQFATGAIGRPSRLPESRQGGELPESLRRAWRTGASGEVATSTGEVTKSRLPESRQGGSLPGGLRPGASGEVNWRSHEVANFPSLARGGGVPEGAWRPDFISSKWRNRDFGGLRLGLEASWRRGGPISSGEVGEVVTSRLHDWPGGLLEARWTDHKWRSRSSHDFLTSRLTRLRHLTGLKVAKSVKSRLPDFATDPTSPLDWPDSHILGQDSCPHQVAKSRHSRK